MMYSLDEVGLIPAITSTIQSRRLVNPYYDNGKLPLFVAPMTCILDKNNIQMFDAYVHSILPVTSEKLEDRIKLPNDSNWEGWIAMTMQEFKYYFIEENALNNKKHYILIDVANGHMQELYDLVKEAKERYSNLIIMIGNIANPNTYIECCKARVDYVRIGIGGGSGCTTSVQTGIHASIPWILEEIKKVKNRIRNHELSLTYSYVDPELAKLNGFRTKIIADGGINTIDKAIKALALGADYVMMGKLFAQCEEAGYGHTIQYRNVPYKGKDCFQREHLYYGQASKEGQLDRFGEIKSNPEGTSLWIPIEYNLNQFIHHFKEVLCSAMSYCNAYKLDDFIGKVQYEYMSINEFKAYDK